MAEIGRNYPAVFAFCVIYIEIIVNKNIDTYIDKKSQVPVRLCIVECIFLFKKVITHTHFKKVKMSVK